MRAASLLLAKGLCHAPMGHMAALDPYSSEEWGPTAHAGLKTCALPVGGPDARQGGLEPAHRGLDIIRGGSRTRPWRSRLMTVVLKHFLPWTRGSTRSNPSQAGIGSQGQWSSQTGPDPWARLLTSLVSDYK
jgi:hypothetical protein